MERILYIGTKNVSSWAFRAWLPLRELGIEFKEQVVDIRKPQRFDNLRRIGEISPAASVPVLVENQSIIFDSLAIMEYANDIGGGNLLPSDPLLRARARSFLSWQHAGLSGLCPRLSFESAFYPDKRQMTQEEQIDAERLFRCWEQELSLSGGPYLCGDLSLADLALVPTVIRIYSHRPQMRSWPLTHQWIKRLLARESVEEWMSEARNLPPIILDNYR
ncbi:glutathione S-transferase family protein [Microbulbifer sp. THAF38]|uniref:glutathione S-transferase family protein n=1 Tax=Microbulbifer sp. THAF38 TaxID=2587856 RepID=UPI001268B582|nr:glutathione S-transferase family protein [Microbulbifer sp. THAF38]QFT55853.1 Dichloromethane dehalogenase [Microbulbifer sp. THAF38]